MALICKHFPSVYVCLSFSGCQYQSLYCRSQEVSSGLNFEPREMHRRLATDIMYRCRVYNYLLMAQLGTQHFPQKDIENESLLSRPVDADIHNHTL